MKNIFDAAEFGASAEKDINTAEIQGAIDACCEAGGGKVVFSPGTYVTGSLELKANVELHLGAGCRIEGSKNIADYDNFEAPGFICSRAPEKTHKHLIRAVCAENIAITGPGEINGSGLSFYSAEEIKKRRKPAQRPRILMFYKCKKVRLQETSFMDSPCWTMWLMKCEDVFIEGLKVFGSNLLLNNDGIDVDSCKNVIISDCVLNTQDDSLVIRAMCGMFDEPGVCENISVANCVLESRCQGIRIGCPGDSVIRNCSFSNMVLSGRNGIHFENPQRYAPKDGRAGADIHDMVFSNFVIDCTGYPIRLFVEEGIELTRFSGISFSNFRIKSGLPVVVEGSSETAIGDVSFSNIDIETRGDDAILCRNCKGVVFHNVRMSNVVSEK